MRKNKVVTNKGLIPIDEMVKNFSEYENLKVLSWNEDKEETEWDDILYARADMVRSHDMIQISGHSGLDLIVSKWHPFYVLDENMKVTKKRADDIVVGDKLLSGTNNVMEKNETMLSCDVAWLLGYFIGDGSMSATRRRVRFYDSDRAILERVDRILLNEGIISKPHTIGCRNKRSKTLKELDYASKRIVNFFLSYGFKPGKKSLTVCFTPEIKSQLNYYNGFSLLGGLIDSDGNINSANDVEFCTSSPYLANDIMWLCHLLGIKSTYRIRNQINHPSQKPSDNDSYYIRISHRELYPVVDRFNMIKKPTGEIKKRRNFKGITQFTKVTGVSDVVDSNLIIYDIDTVNNHNYMAGTSRLVFM